MKKAYVVLLNWNGWGDTLECLESLLRGDYAGLRVVVCDNGSTDGSLTYLKAWAAGELDVLPSAAGELRGLSFPPVPKPVPCRELTRAQAEAGEGGEDDCPLLLVDNGENLGFAGGNNVGLRYLLQRDDFAFAWLLNNDTVVNRDALSQLVARAEQSPGAGMIGSTLLHYHRPSRVQAFGGAYYCRWIGLPWHLGRLHNVGDPVDVGQVERRMDYVVGASVLVTRSFLREIGPLCEDYFLYFEELDWALRGAGRFTLAWAQQSLVYHKVGASIGTSSNPANKSVTCDYWNARNRIFFTRRWFPYALPTVYLALVGTLLTRVMLGRWDRVGMLHTLLLGGWRAAPAAERSCAGND